MSYRIEPADERPYCRHTRCVSGGRVVCGATVVVVVVVVVMVVVAVVAGALVAGTEVGVVAAGVVVVVGKFVAVAVVEPILRQAF